LICCGFENSISIKRGKNEEMEKCWKHKTRAVLQNVCKMFEENYLNEKYFHSLKEFV
jgi:hypothetical protein